MAAIGLTDARDMAESRRLWRAWADEARAVVARAIRDYTRPLDVEPVCTACNVSRGPAAPLAGRALLGTPVELRRTARHAVAAVVLGAALARQRAAADRQHAALARHSAPAARSRERKKNRERFSGP